MLTYDTEKAGEYLGVTSKRVRELIKSKRLNAKQNPVSFKWEVPAKSLKKYITSSKRIYGRPRNVDAD